MYVVTCKCNRLYRRCQGPCLHTLSYKGLFCPHIYRRHIKATFYHICENSGLVASAVVGNGMSTVLDQYYMNIFVVSTNSSVTFHMFLYLKKMETINYIVILY